MRQDMRDMRKVRESDKGDFVGRDDGLIYLVCRYLILLGPGYISRQRVSWPHGDDARVVVINRHIQPQALTFFIE
jgi:hypothetical protein